VLNSWVNAQVDVAGTLKIIDTYFHCIAQSYSVTLKELNVVYLQTPQQTNACDRGIYVIEFIRVWLNQKSLDRPMPEFDDKLDCVEHRQRWRLALNQEEYKAADALTINVRRWILNNKRPNPSDDPERPQSFKTESTPSLSESGPSITQEHPSGTKRKLDASVQNVLVKKLNTKTEAVQRGKGKQGTKTGCSQIVVCENIQTDHSMADLAIKNTPSQARAIDYREDSNEKTLKLKYPKSFSTEDEEMLNYFHQILTASMESDTGIRIIDEVCSY